MPQNAKSQPSRGLLLQTSAQKAIFVRELLDRMNDLSGYFEEHDYLPSENEEINCLLESFCEKIADYQKRPLEVTGEEFDAVENLLREVEGIVYPKGKDKLS